MKKLPQPKTVTIRDVGGIRDAVFELRPGVNQLTGQNGAGKSTAIAAISRAYGAKVTIEPRDGAREGSVAIDGVRLTVKGVVKAEGRAELAIADETPIATLIDPGLKDTDRAAEARIRALVALVRMPLTPDVVGIVAGHSAIVSEVQPLVDEATVTDLLTLAERCRTIGNRLALEQEKAATAEAALAAGARHQLEVVRERLKLPHDATEPPECPFPGAAKEAAELAVRALEVARVTCRQREELEAQQAAARATLGKKPDPESLDPDIQARQDALVAAERRAHGIAEEVSAARAAFDAKMLELTERAGKNSAAVEAIRTDFRTLLQLRKDAEAALARWNAQAAILERPVSGATPAEVTQLEHAAGAAKAVVNVSELSAQFISHHLATILHDNRADLCNGNAEALRATAQSTTERLGLVLQDSGAGGLTVNNGRLAVIEGDRVLDFETRQSFGQRVAHALRIAASCYAGKVVPLSPVFWTALDDQHRREFAALAEQHDLYVLTEQPADGALRMEHIDPSEAAG